MKLETERLILRRWKDSDAEDLYKYASDPDVGPIAGWPPHQSIEESRSVISNVLNGKEAYAICLKTDGKAIGAIELKLNGHTDMTERGDECELGYWLGKPFWGQGIMPEAAGEMLRHAFEDIGMTKVWCGYYEGNAKSKRVQEKLGFQYQWTSENLEVAQLQEIRTGYVNRMTKEDWLQLQDTVCLHTPKVRELWFRERMMADSETMSYNHALGTTIPFPQEKWESWYSYWIIHHENQRYYRYLVNGMSAFLGEIAYHYDAEYDGYIADVILYAPYRNKGYGTKGLKLLCEAAKENGIGTLLDNIAIDNPAISLFLKNGFTEAYRTNEIILLKKDL